ncbi:MAG TPA: aminotransferase class V-fold PLP-dependent enzyme [Acidimicrobiales bacterium]|nr:aminotransferase class V-fold PLP-dependent enzyme [Acidimicrobiales bacterium]
MPAHLPIVPIDVDRARADTPGCELVAHLNHAGTSLAPRPVLDAQIEWLHAEALTGGYELAADREADRRATYDEVAALVGARSDEMALVENATFAWHQAFWSLPLRPGDRILACTVAYASSYVSFLQAERRRGVSIEVIPDDDDGQLSVRALASLLDDGRAPVGLVAVTQVPTNGGLVNPVAEVGALCREAGVPFLLDACQAVGQLPVDVDEIGCDLLSATGRKFLRAPRGTGFLYVRRSLLERLDRMGAEPAFLDLLGADWVAPDGYAVRRDARRFENWESNMAAVAGLRAAVAYARSWGLDAIAERVGTVAESLRGRLGEVPGVRVHDLGRHRSGIVTFTVDGVAADDVQARLRGQGINVSVSGPSSTRLDAERRRLPPLVRASVHYVTVDAELDRLTGAVAAMAAAAPS